MFYTGNLEPTAVMLEVASLRMGLMWMHFSAPRFPAAPIMPRPAACPTSDALLR